MKIGAGDIEIAYDEVGTGTPVLFVHGFPHARRLWQPQLSGLEGDCRCIAPDLRGFGESSVRGPYDMDRYADDLAALLDALDIPRCVLVGLSMGGYIAFAMWRRHRERIAALVLADTRAEADDDEGREKRRKMMATAREQGMGAVADAMIQGMVGKTTRETDPELVRRVHDLLASAPVDGAVGALEAMMNRPDSTGTLREITVPVTIIVGEEDALTPPRLARSMHEALPSSTLVVLPQAGHVSNLEQPSAFNAAIRRAIPAGPTPPRGRSTPLGSEWAPE